MGQGLLFKTGLVVLVDLHPNVVLLQLTTESVDLVFQLLTPLDPFLFQTGLSEEVVVEPGDQSVSLCLLFVGVVYLDDPVDSVHLVVEF